MNRREVIAGLALSLLAGQARAQQGKMARVGFLSPAGAANVQTAAFQEGLKELGYVEGQNIHVEYRWASGQFDRLPALAAELVRLKVDVIVTVVTQASIAARQATSEIP